MPINFSPQQPYSPDIALAYGRAVASQQSMPLLQRQAEANQQARLQAAALAIRAGEAQSQSEAQIEAIRERGFARQSEEQMQQARLGAQANRDIFMAQAEERQIGVRAQAAVWANQQELSAHEQLRLTRLKNELGIIQSDPTLTAQEKSDATVFLQTRISPLQMRKDRQQAKQLEMENDILLQKAAQMKNIEITNQDYERKLKEMGIGTLVRRDPNTGEYHEFFKNDRTGEWYNPMRAGGRGSAEQQEHPTGLKPQAYLGIFERTQKAVEREIADTIKQHDDEGGSIAAWWTPQRRSEAVANRMRELGLPGSFGEYQSQGGGGQPALRQDVPPQPFQGVNAPPGAQPQPVGLAPPGQPQPQPISSAPPTPPPVERLSSDRAAEFRTRLVDDLTAVKAAVKDDPQAAAAAAEMITIARRAGSVEDMTPEERDRFEQARARLNMLRRFPAGPSPFGTPAPVPIFPGQPNGPTVPGNVAAALR